MDYRSTSERLLERPSVAEIHGNRVDPTSATLAGPYGAIWPWDSSGRYFVLVVNAYVNNRWRVDKIQSGEETGFVCDEATARLWIKRLKIPKTRPAQARWMDKHSRGET